MTDFGAFHLIYISRPRFQASLVWLHLNSGKRWSFLFFPNAFTFSDINITPLHIIENWNCVDNSIWSQVIFLMPKSRTFTRTSAAELEHPRASNFQAYFFHRYGSSFQGVASETSNPLRLSLTQLKVYRYDLCHVCTGKGKNEINIFTC